MFGVMCCSHYQERFMQPCGIPCPPEFGGKWHEHVLVSSSESWLQQPFSVTSEESMTRHGAGRGRSANEAKHGSMRGG